MMSFCLFLFAYLSLRLWKHMASCGGDGIEFKDEAGSYQPHQGGSDISGGAARQGWGRSNTFLWRDKPPPPYGWWYKASASQTWAGSSYFNSWLKGLFPSHTDTKTLTSQTGSKCTATCTYTKGNLLRYEAGSPSRPPIGLAGDRWPRWNPRPLKTNWNTQSNTFTTNKTVVYLTAQ